MYHIQLLIDKCRRSTDGQVIPEMAKIAKKLASYGVLPNNAIPYIEEFTAHSDDGSIVDIDYETLDRIPEFHKNGFDDVETIQASKFLKTDLEDKNQVKSFIFDLHNAQIKTPAALNLLDKLSVFNEDKKSYSIQPAAVKTLISLKKVLTLTRNNEYKERNNEIAKEGLSYMEAGDQTFVFKNGDYKYSFSKTKLSPGEVISEYGEMMSNIEDDLLAKFVGKYKVKGGLLNHAAVRVFTSLRCAGIIHGNLFDLISSIVSKNTSEIDGNKLGCIERIMGKGALSTDISTFLDIIDRDENGKYNEEQIETVCDLTEAKIGANDIKLLLPEINGDKDIRYMISYCASGFSNKANLAKLIPMVKTKDGVKDENACDTVCKITQKVFNEDYLASETEETMISDLNTIFSEAKDPDTDMVSDEAAGTCSILADKGYGIYDIKDALIACQDKDGHADEAMSETLWDLAVKDVELPQIFEALDACRDSEYHINETLTALMFELLNSGNSIEDVINLVSACKSQNQDKTYSVNEQNCTMIKALIGQNFSVANILNLVAKH